MGLLSAFAGGFAGPGFVTMSDRLNKREELDQVEAARARELALDRQARSDDWKGRESSALELAALKASLAAGGAGGAKGTRAGRVAGSEFNLADVEDAIMARDHGMTAPEVEALRQGQRNGMGPTIKGDDVRAAGDTREMRPNVPNPDAGADPAVFREGMKRLGAAQFEAKFAGSSAADDTAKAAAGYRDQRLSDAAIADPNKAGAIGTGQAAAAGKPLYKVEGNTQLQEFTGNASPTKVGEAVISKDRAEAADHSASAGSKNDARKVASDNGGMTPTERVGLINSYESAAKRTADEVKNAEADLVKAQAAAAKAIGTDAKAAAQQGVDQLTKRIGDLRVAADKAAADADSARAQRRAPAEAAKPADVAMLRKQAAAAIAAGKSADAVKALFKKKTGQDY